MHGMNIKINSMQDVNFPFFGESKIVWMYSVCRENYKNRWRD